MPISSLSIYLLSSLKRRFIPEAFLLLIAVIFPWESALAECSPFQLSLASPAQLVAEERNICGLSVNLITGKNRSVWGIDAGLVNQSQEFRGIEAGALVNLQTNSEDNPSLRSWGLQVAGVANSNAKASFTGIQAAGLFNNNESAGFTGIQAAGLMNHNDGMLHTGMQLAVFSNQNYNGEVTGLQAALFNQSKKINGMQIGLANGVTAGEGAVGVLLIPVYLFLGLIHWNGPVPGYVESAAHIDVTVNGTQLGAIANIAEVVNGMQIGMVNYSGQSLDGIQMGFINNPSNMHQYPADVQGFQLGLVTNFARDMTGIQIGGLNSARDVKSGVQVGLVNVCKNLTGVQLGFINIVTSRFPNSVFFAPIANVGF